ncbi:hypothetical protein YTPLAS18_07650 [Nitrospira sp.]|nr:hypothetical protein YTPLAS18_07650 [Nitrospira sp.]
MNVTRRTIIKSALASALAVATTESLLSAAERSASPNERYLLVALRNGNYLAIDRVGPKRAFLLTRGPAQDGEYLVAPSGRVRIQRGVPAIFP